MLSENHECRCRSDIGWKVVATTFHPMSFLYRHSRFSQQSEVPRLEATIYYETLSKTSLCVCLVQEEVSVSHSLRSI